MSRPIVDVWIQHPTRRFLALPIFDSLRRWTGSDFAEVPLATTLAAMDQAGVEIAFTAAWHGPQGELIGNDEVAAWVGESEGRLLGMAAVDLARPMAAVRELRRCVNDLGFRALRVVPWLWGLPPDDRRYYPLYAECVELGVPFCLQVGLTGPLVSSAAGRPIPHLENVALDFPELTIVAGHIGAPWAGEMIALAMKFENVFIDTSAYKAKRYPPELVGYLRGGGAKKVMFGSNYPMLTPAQALEGLDALGLGEGTLELFLAGNARRVFGLDSG